MNETRSAYDERAACPLYTAIAVIEGRWKPMILQRLSDRPHGFGELRRAMPRVTTKVLREQLRQLIADDLVVREPGGGASRGIARYEVTPHGRSLGPVLESLWRWGTRHLEHPGAAAGTRATPPSAAPVRQATGT